jgi:hypothetical protein
MAADTASAPGSPFRYEDDPTVYADAPADDVYAKFKYVPLGPQEYLSLGADLRERVEASDVGLLGFRNPGAEAYDLHRLLVFADLQLGPDIRGFVQLGDHEEVGRRPAAIPTDVDQLDLSQGFLDASADLAGGRATLRLGRAEMSFDDGAIIGLRDGPNVRQVWDGVRITYVAGPWRWYAFAVEPVSVKPGVFDDGPLHDQSIEGVHLTVTPPGTLAADSFYYHNLKPPGEPIRRFWRRAHRHLRPTPAWVAWAPRRIGRRHRPDGRRDRPQGPRLRPARRSRLALRQPALGPACDAARRRAQRRRP